MKHREFLAFYLMGSVLILLLLIQFWLSSRMYGKIKRIESRLNLGYGSLEDRQISEERRYLKEEIDKLQKQMTSVEKNLPAMHKEEPQFGVDAKQWSYPTESFQLTPDPYFENLYKGKHSNQTITLGITSDEKSFNRTLENSAQLVEWHDYYINNRLAERHWQNPEQWAPHLAVRIEITPDHREFKIHLRRGVLWHKPVVDWTNSQYAWLKGDHYVTSNDFYFAYTTIMNPKVKAQHLLSNYDDIDSFTIIDEYTFSILWKKSLYTNLVYTLEQYPLPAFIFSRDAKGEEVPPHALADNINNHWYNDKMIGCGPYIFSEHQPNKYLEFTRNEEYYGYKPAIGKVRFLVINDSRAAYEKLKAGEINIIAQLPEEIYPEIVPSSKKVNFITQVYPRAVYFHIKWNNAHPIFRDKMVRRAMTYALDRQWVLKNIFMGLGVVATCDIPPDSNYHNGNIEPYRYDLNLARKILEDQGWRDENGDGIVEKIITGRKIDFSFTLYYTQKSDASLRKTFTLYADALKNIGVQMTHEEKDWAQIMQRYESKDFEAIYGGWLTDIPLVDFSQIWHSKFADIPTSSNQIHFKNTEVDLICQKMREATVLNERIKLAHRMQEILHDEQPYTFLFFTKGVAVFSRNVQNRFIRKIRPYVLIHPYYME